jgi:glycerophosphoryl diester phosphodiesterase
MDVLKIVRLCLCHWRSIFLVHLLFTLLSIALLTPLVAGLVQALLAFSGSVAVSDQDIAWLLLTPFGMGAAVFVVSLFLAIMGLEMGAMLLLVASARHRDVVVSPWEAMRYGLRHALPMLRLTLGLSLRVLAILMPFLLSAAAVGWWLLTEHDINYYLSEKPPQFLLAIAIGGLLALALFLVLGRQFLRWSLALPLTVFADVPGGEAFSRSSELTRDKLSGIMRALAAWFALALALACIPAAFLALAGNALMYLEIDRLGTLVICFGAIALLWSLLNFLAAGITIASLNALFMAGYEQFCGSVSSAAVRSELRSGGEAAVHPQATGRALLAGAVIAALFGAMGLYLAADIGLEDKALVIAHRGAAGAAPENTLAAVRRAIEDRTDWVEIDVQESCDGQVVVVHDSDFMKLAHNPLKVWDGDLATIQGIDIGTWFAPEFAGQRVPTLAQVLAEIKGVSKLVIELKYYGHDQQLEQRVVDIVEAAGMADDIVIMSLKLPGVEKIRALRPDWTVGLLAAAAVGDLTRLDVDFLAVNAKLANAGFIKRAHKAGKQVFVWTINDALSLSEWMSRGVDGVITDEPALARDVLAQRAEMSSGERLLLSAVSYFGLPPRAGKYRDASP